jgi:hypothetical protein
MTRDGQFIAAALDAELTEVTAEQASDNFWLACKILRDPLIAKRIWAKTLAWNESNPFKDTDENEIEAAQFPDFDMEVAQELTRPEKLELRKRILG